MRVDRPADGGRGVGSVSSRTRGSPRNLSILLLGMGCAAAYLWASRGPASAVPWQQDHATALQAAAAQQRGVLIRFTTPGCTYCVQMDREVFARRDAVALVEGLIPLSVDGSRTPALLRQYDVNAFPTFIVLGPDGLEIDRTVGAMSRDAFAAFVHHAREALPRPNGT